MNTLANYKTKRSYREESRTALRFAAMAAASLAAGIGIKKVSIIPDGRSAGIITQVLDDDKPDPTLQTDLMIMCAGPAAESFLTGIDYQPTGDRMQLDDGSDIDSLLKKLPKAKRNDALNKAMQTAENVVKSNWKLIKQLQSELMAAGQLDRDDIEFSVKFYKLQRVG
jgi:hypothetical protein